MISSTAPLFRDGNILIARMKKNFWKPVLVLSLTLSLFVFMFHTHFSSISVSTAAIPRKVYIDGGANLANSLFMFQEAKGDISATHYSRHWEVYSFEASLELAAYTQVVVTALNRGLSLDEARKLVHWNATVDECVMKCYTENQPYSVCDPLIADWHYRTIQPLMGEALDTISPGKINTKSKQSDHDTFTAIHGAMCDANTKELAFEFSFSNYVNGGSNGMNLNTHSGGEQRKYTVPCVPIAKWIMDSFDEKDYIILKLDIEGAEYSVMSDLLYNGALRYVDELIVEWHSRFGSVQQYESFEKALQWVAESHGIIWHVHNK